MMIKPKRQWSKVKDYNKKKAFRALRRKGLKLLLSFDDGTDDHSYFDWATKAQAYKGIPIEPNERTFNYMGWYNNNVSPYRHPYAQYAFLNDAPGAHFDDYNKGVYHPTFSTGSRYSGVVDPYWNPKGYEGGYMG